MSPLPLPHAYPFLLLDRVVELDPGRGAVAIKNLTRTDPLLDATGQLPPVLLVEAMTQAAGLAVGAKAPGADASLAAEAGMLVRIDRFRTRGRVQAGDQLRVRVRIVRVFGVTVKAGAVVTVDDRPRAGAVQGFADVFAREVRGLDSVKTVQARLELEPVRDGIFGPYLYNYVPLAAYDELQSRLTPAGIDAALAADRAILQAPFDLTAAEWVRRDPLGFVPFAARSMLQDELGRLLRRELVWSCLGAFALNLVLVLGNFPRLGTAVAILIPEALVIIALLALMRTLGVGIGPVNVIVVPLILGIGVDNCVYVAARCQQGESPGDALNLGGRAMRL